MALLGTFAVAGCANAHGDGAFDPLGIGGAGTPEDPATLVDLQLMTDLYPAAEVWVDGVRGAVSVDDEIEVRPAIREFFDLRVREAGVTLDVTVNIGAIFEAGGFRPDARIVNGQLLLLRDDVTGACFADLNCVTSTETVACGTYPLEFFERCGPFAP